MIVGLFNKRFKGGSHVKASGRGCPFLIRRHVVHVIQSIPVLWKLNVWRVGRIVLSNDQGLRERKYIGSEPVNGQTSRYLERKVSNHERQEFQDNLRLFHLFLLVVAHAFIVRGWRQDGHGEGLSENEHHWHDEKGQRRFPTQLWNGGAIGARSPALCQPFHASKGWCRDGTFQRWNPEKGFLQETVLRQVANTSVKTQQDR
mmetsp:Transcript_11986/g.19881  ORF Transcript_11986/g.19881 Transcript_11986/m.19881 type:complete len:202 (+) Transcript_11986:278-883(+)